MKKLVNAGIKSKRELAERLLAGEEIYAVEGRRVYFSEDSTDSPFLLEYSQNESDHMLGIWNNYANCLVKREVPWYENITKPVPCWVSNRETSIRDHIDLVDSVIKINNVPIFRAVSEVYWGYATPLTPEDLLEE